MTVRWFGALVALGLLAPVSADAQATPQGASRVLDAATQAKDLTFPTEASASADGSRMALLKPEGSGPFPAIVLQHQCSGLRARGSANRSVATWANAAVSEGYVVLLIDSLGPRDVDTVCLGPKKGVNFFRGARDALQAAGHLRTLSFVDKQRIAHVGFSWGAMSALLTSSHTGRLVLPNHEAFAASVALYPGCFTIRPPATAPYEIVQNDIDRPILVLMGDQDTETPPRDCITKLESAKQAGAPAEWHLFHGATHCWDCNHLDGFSKTDARGVHVTYRYNPDVTLESKRRLFAFLEKAFAAER